MKELEKNELMELNGGGSTNTNYIAGLSPAIPESGGEFLAGFLSGFFRALFSI
jgi:hypothetical protein